MNILIPVLGFGKQGGYRVLSKMASEWVDMGCKVSFISVADSIYPHYPTKAEILWVKKGKLVPENTKVLKKTWLKKAMAFVTRFIDLKKGIEKVGFDYDIVLANQSLTAFPVSWAKIDAHKCYYIQSYEPLQYAASNEWYSFALRQLSIRSYKLSLYQIVNSPVITRSPNINAQEFVFPGIDLSIFFKKNTSVGTHTLTIGCIGRKEPFKGTAIAIDAYQILKKNGLEINMKIAFGQEYFDNDNDIRFERPSNDTELAAYYRSLDILIAAGTLELGAIHYPVIEAMACGTNVITTGYYPANDSNAVIVPVNNAEAIATAIINLLKDPQMALAKAEQAHKDVQQFAWRKQSTKMLEIFQRLS